MAKTSYYVLSEKDRRVLEDTVRRVMHQKGNSSKSEKDPIGGFSRIYIAQAPSAIDAISIDTEEETVTVGISTDDVKLMGLDENDEGVETGSEAHRVINVSLQGIPKDVPFILFRAASGEWIAQPPVVTQFAWATTTIAVNPDDTEFEVDDIQPFDGSTWEGDSPLTVSNDPDSFSIDVGVRGKIMSLVTPEGVIEWHPLDFPCPIEPYIPPQE